LLLGPSAVVYVVFHIKTRINVTCWSQFLLGTRVIRFTVQNIVKDVHVLSKIYHVHGYIYARKIYLLQYSNRLFGKMEEGTEIRLIKSTLS